MVRDFIGGCCLYGLAFGVLYAGFAVLGITGFAAALFAASLTCPMAWVSAAVLSACGAVVRAFAEALKPGR